MARNHEEDQKSELEALESIYYNELEGKSVCLLRKHVILFIFLLVIEQEPRIKFTIKITTEEYNETQDGLTCDLLFTFPTKYPDEAPLLEIEEDNFEDDLVKEKLTDAVQLMIQENMGTEMIFSLVAGAQELLNTLFDEIKLERDAAKAKKELEIEEAERKRFEGTRVSGYAIFTGAEFIILFKVTVETFMNWRNEFEKEMGIAEKKAKEAEANRKLTGRELFIRDQSLIDSGS